MVGKATMNLDLRDTMRAEAYLLGGYELELVKFISRRLKDGGVLVDVGANIGLIALPVAAANPAVRVIAFEPHPGNAHALRENVTANPGLQVEVREVALGAELGRAHLTTDDPQQSGWFRISGAGEGIAVSLDTLDRALGNTRVDVMKVDAEGSEPEILRGACRLLAERSIGCLITEVNPGYDVSANTLADYVAGFGYRQAPAPVSLGRRLRRLGEETAVFIPGVEG